MRHAAEVTGGQRSENYLCLSGSRVTPAFAAAAVAAAGDSYKQLGIVFRLRCHGLGLGGLRQAEEAR